MVVVELTNCHDNATIMLLLNNVEHAKRAFAQLKEVQGVDLVKHGYFNSYFTLK